LKKLEKYVGPVPTYFAAVLLELHALYNAFCFRFRSPYGTDRRTDGRARRPIRTDA